MSGADDGVVLHDLEHLGLPGAIGTYLLKDPEPALVDPGPATTLGSLRDFLDGEGVGVQGLRHLLLTHIHLDHAGASGALARENPSIRIHVHADGAPHMEDPSRLVSSTRRTFGEAHDRLWGETLPVPRDNLRPWSPGDGDVLPGIRPVPSPGHIDHHLAWLHEGSGILFAGDSMGIVLAADAPTHPPTPPPSLDLRAWLETLDGALKALDPERFAVTHFGLHDRFHRRRGELREALVAVGKRAGEALEEDRVDAEAERFEEEVRSRLGRHVPRERVDAYFDVFPAGTDFRGTVFYLERNDFSIPDDGDGAGIRKGGENG